MEFVNIHDAKTNLSKYLGMVENSHETIVICRSGKPIAQITRFKKPKKRRKLGLLRGKINIHDDFDELPKDFMDHFQ